MVDTLSKNRINSLKNYHDPFFFTKESERLETFRGCGNPEEAEELAKLGFYLWKNRARCAHCNAEIGLNSVKAVLEDHRRWSPACPSLNRGVLPPDRDVCGNVDTFTDSASFLKTLVRPYDDFDSRRKSFDTWPPSCKQSPEVLAAAGFYYQGVGDKTVCFCCSGPLNNWEDDDDPWTEHARWFPKCKFLLDAKGEGFVEEAQKKSKMRERPERAIDEDKMCVICCDNQREVVFVPCGHDWTCLGCMRALEDKKCPICREQIVRIKNLYSY